MNTVEEMHLENRILGCIYGNCIGDAIGLLTEFMTRAEAQVYYGSERNLLLEYDQKVSDKHRDCWVNGDWTDDSDQMILIMDSIIHCEKETKAKKVNVVDFAERLDTWSYNGFQELGDTGGFGLGYTTKSVLTHKKFLSKPHQAAKDAWERSGRFVAPNGAVMRTSILGIYNYKDLQSVQENCKAIAKVTHADPRCLASCVAVCSAICFMLQRQQRHLTSHGYIDVERITQDSFNEAKKVFEEDVERNSEELWQHMNVENLSSLQLDEPGKIGYTYKSLGAGFWALKHRDFRSALTSITMEAGDADTNGAVAGALLGCKLGFEFLPDTWLDGLVHKQWLDNKIYRFMKATMPELKMKYIHFDENYDPSKPWTPRRMKREGQKRAENAEASKPQTKGKPLKTKGREHVVSDKSDCPHGAQTGESDHKYDVQKGESDRGHNVEKEKLDHACDVQRGDSNRAPDAQTGESNHAQDVQEGKLDHVHDVQKGESDHPHGLQKEKPDDLDSVGNNIYDGDQACGSNLETMHHGQGSQNKDPSHSNNNANRRNKSKEANK